MPSLKFNKLVLWLYAYIKYYMKLYIINGFNVRLHIINKYQNFQIKAKYNKLVT